MPRNHPGSNELEWLADLKPLAEEIGQDVLGFEVDWRVESGLAQSRKRPDVVVERKSDRSALFSGEAKRPDSPAGLHPLIDSEVGDAIAKAQAKNLPFCFTTNFHQVAVLGAGPGLAINPVMRLQGDLIGFVPEALDIAPNWWRELDQLGRESAARPGLRALFGRYSALDSGVRPTMAVDDVVIGFFRTLTDALLDPLAEKFIVRRGSLSAAIRHRALAAGLDPNNNQECRYLVAQGIVEVLSAGLFYQVLRDYFGGLGPLFAGTRPTSARALADRVGQSLGDAMRESGDYEPILNLSAVAESQVV